ncbi:MAG: YigZ family protein [Flavobacteriaceae bacterium]|nr:YigZ family protein [Flavobacteriaceae bacterium]
MKDSYKTVMVASEETLFKEKGSKFFGYAFPVLNEDEIKSVLTHLRKRHNNAVHYCYAWQLGFDSIRFRVNDDGEPNNSAGLPIYGQLKSFEVTNILVVSVRYFGGVKLGMGGLIKAYKHSAKITLDGAQIVEKTIDVTFRLSFDYDLTNKVMQIIKVKNLKIVSQKLEINCLFTIVVRKMEANTVFDLFNNLYKMKIEKVESNRF